MANRDSFSSEEAMAALNDVSEDAPPALDPNDREGPIDDEDEEDAVQADAEDGDEQDEQDESDVEASATDDEEDGDGSQEETTDDVEETEDQDEPAQPTIDPPQHLDEAGKAEFKAMPRKAQEFVVKQAQLLQADYSRKTGEVAAQRKQLDNRLKSLAGVRTELETRVEKWKKIDWARAAQTWDPKKYNAQVAMRDQDMARLRNVRTEQERHEQADWSNHVVREKKELEAKYSFLAGDANKSKREAVYSALKAAGVPDERARWIGADEMAYVWKALQWDKYQAERKKNPLTKKVKTDAKTPGKKVRPTGRSTPSNANASQAGRQLASFRKTPTVNGARAALDALDID